MLMSFAKKNYINNSVITRYTTLIISNNRATAKTKMNLPFIHPHNTSQSHPISLLFVLKLINPVLTSIRSLECINPKIHNGDQFYLKSDNKNKEDRSSHKSTTFNIQESSTIEASTKL